MRNYLPHVRNSKLFYNMAEEEILQLLTCLDSHVKHYHAGDTLWRAGERVHQVGVVLTGRIHVEDYDFIGNKSLVAEYAQGQSFGEEHALSHERPLPFDVVAQEDATILFFSIQKVSAPCSINCMGHHKLIENLLSSVATHAYDLEMKVSHISKRTTREKLISYLSEQARLQHSAVVTIPFNRQELADFLAVERSAMSKELAKMKKEGLLDYKHNTFILKLAEADLKD